MRATVTIDEDLRAKASKLAALLERDVLLAHPFVIGEIARGSLSDRGRARRGAGLHRPPQAARQRRRLHPCAWAGIACRRA